MVKILDALKIRRLQVQPLSGAFLIILSSAFGGCAGHVAVPELAVADANLSSTNISDTKALMPALTSNGTEPMEILEPDSKIKLPRRGEPFLYGLTITESLEDYYRAVNDKQEARALEILEDVESKTTDDLMRYAATLLRVRLLIPTGQIGLIENTLNLLSEREIKAFGKNLESTALRGEANLWRGNLEEARSYYTKVLLTIGDWRVPTFYMRPPSNNNEIIYYGRAQLTANIGLAGILILQGEYESALAWAEDGEKRFLDILGLTRHRIYGKYTKATPDLYTSHGWCLAFLAGARLGYSKNFQASENIFQRAEEYFAIEGHIEGARAAQSVREYVSLKLGLVKKPTFLIGMLSEPFPDGRTAETQLPKIIETEQRKMTLSLPSLPVSFLKLPRSGEESPFGFKVTLEYEKIFRFYLEGKGDEALAVLDAALAGGALEPAAQWAYSFLRAQVLILMGRAADAEIELEKTGEWEGQAFGTNMNARSLRGEARFWIGDYDAAIKDFMQVIKAAGDWRLPTTYVFPPPDVSQLALRTRAQLRAFAGMANALIRKRNYAQALQWAKAAENLFQDLYQVIQHPLYHDYVALDADMVYGRGLNFGILGAAMLVQTKDIRGSDAVFQQARNYFEALGFPLGQVTVDTFRFRALLDIEANDVAEPFGDELVHRAIEMGFFDLVWQIEALLGEVRLKEGRAEEAEAAFRRAQAAVDDVSGSLASDRAKRRFGIGKEEITLRLVERDIQKEKWDDLFRDLEQSRARAFVDMLAEQELAGHPEAQAVKEIRDMDKKIRRQRLRNASPNFLSAEGIKAEKELLELRQSKVLELRKQDPEIAEVLSGFAEELSGIAQRLAGGEVMAYALPVRSPEENFRFLIIRSEGAQVEVSDISGEKLRNSLKTISSLNQKISISDQQESAQRLRQDLHLATWGAESGLYIVPTGDLYFVPWGALETNYPVTVLPTGSWLKRFPKAVPAAKPASVVGDPETSGTLPRLPGAREEAGTVSAIYGVSALVGEMATEEALRRDMEGGVRVLHLATHGFFDGTNPLNSSVVLSDGRNPYRLTAAKIFEHPLPAQLVVLSACETGLGKAVAGDDFLGLARSFYLGGTRALVYSLWPVHDVPSKLFMEEFHRRAVSGDYGKAWLEARDFLKQKGFSPSQYGAFILGGRNLEQTAG